MTDKSPAPAELQVIVERHMQEHAADFKAGHQELLVEQITAWHEAELAQARLAERQNVALDNYYGHTFSDSTNWKGKFDKFINNNEARIAALKDGAKGLE